MNKKITILLALMCIVSLLFVFAACDGEGEGLPSGEIGSGQPDGEIPSGSVGSSAAFIIEDNVVVGLTEYGKTLEKLVVPRGVTAIGDYALAGRLNLLSVSLPSSLKSIGKSAFQGCSSLPSIVIPNSVTSIGESAFEDCRSLTIYCEAESRPSGWHEGWRGDWNIDDDPVVWGYQESQAPTYPAGTQVIDGSYQPPQVDDSGYNYSAAFIIEDNVVVGLTEYGKTLEKLVVPSGVTAIGDEALAGDEDDPWNDKLKYVEIPEGVTSIGDYALAVHLNLLSVSLPSSLKSIGGGAFICCSSLTELNIPDGLESVGEIVFLHCNSLVIKTERSSVISDLQNNLLMPTEHEEMLKIPVVYDCQNNEAADDGYIYVIADNGVQYGLKDGSAKVKGRAYVQGEITIASNVVYKGGKYEVNEIDYYAFIEVNSVDKFNIPNSVTTIKAQAFAGCTNITEIDLPDNLKEIGYLGFKSCTSLTSIVIPNGVTSIGDEAFGDCWAMTEAIIPNSLTSIGNFVFSYCSSLTNVEIPNSVNSIGDWAFQDCESLTSIVIPSGVNSIGESAFSNCRSLTNVVIPNSVTSIGRAAFRGCDNLTIYCEASEKPSGWRGDWNIGDNPVVWGYQESQAPTYPAGTQVVGGSYQPPQVDDSGYNYSAAFIIEDNVVVGLTEYGKTLEKLVVPSGVTAIGDEAFEVETTTSVLRSVVLPEGLTSIGEQAFAACLVLESVNLPNSLTSIGYGAFVMCLSLTEVKLPRVYENLNEAFILCPSLVLKVQGSDRIPDADLIFSMTGGMLLEDDYKIPVVYDCQNNEVADDGYIYVIADNGVQYGLKDGVAKVKGHANLSHNDITIANKVFYDGDWYQVNEIADLAFAACVDMTSIKIPNSVTSIGALAFTNCDSMTEIVLPDSLEVIKESAFEGGMFQSVVIPSGVVDIGIGAFAGCFNLSSISVDEDNPKYKSDGNCIIEKDTNKLIIGYESVVPKYVTSIGKRAIDSNLTYIVIPNSVVSIDEEAVWINVIIYCEAESQPSGWDSNWGIYATEIVWGCEEYGTAANGIKWVLTKNNTIAVVGYSGESTQVEIQSTINGYNVTEIRYKAFLCCNLTSIVIPISVTSVESNVFYGCDNLTTIYCEAESQPSGWSSRWNWNSKYENNVVIEVIWGYKGSNI